MTDIIIIGGGPAGLTASIYASRAGKSVLLLEARSYIEHRLNELIDKRKHLQNKIRRATPEEKEKLRAEKSEVSSKIAGLRKHLKINHKIEERSVHIQETLDLMTENEARAKGKVIDKTACNEVQDKGRKQKERDDAR